MFIIGKATQEEIEDMERWGWEVQDVDVKHFDKAHDPNAPEDDEVADRYLDCDEKLVSIFVDKDIWSIFAEWRSEDEAKENMRKRVKLEESRHEKADDAFEYADNQLLNLSDKCEVVDSEGWEYTVPGDVYTKVFYYVENEEEDEDSISATFTVVFEKDSDKIIDVVSNV